MRSPARPRRAALLVLVVSLLAALLAAAPGPVAQAADGTYLVYGQIKFPHRDNPKVKVLWFNRDWGYLGQARADGGGYSLRLPPGTYHLQFVDQRPAYDVQKYAPTDIQVTVRDNSVPRSVRMKLGAAITGTVSAGGHPLKKAKLVAANQSEQSFSTTADKSGRFAVGGLPAGKYCLFTYDRAKTYVDKCTWVGGVDAGQFKNTAVRLRTKAGSLTVFLTLPSGGAAPSSTVTVTSKKTGQWWTTTARSGRAVFTGLYPGSYAVKYDAAGVWLTQEGNVRGATVRSGSGQMAFGDFRLTKRGGWITGAVVDGVDGTRGLPGAVVTLYSASGHKLAETTSSDEGSFTLTGALTTQSGLSIVIAPPQYTDYLGEEPLRCQYVRTEAAGISAATGRETYVGDLGLDRKSPQNKPGCEA